MSAAARILIMAGGTGGHVFPGLAVAEALREAGAEVRWLGTRRGLEARLVPAAGIPLDTLAVSGLRGKGPASWLAAPVKVGWALAQALALILRFRPMTVLGMGGFAAGPGGVMAWLLRLPLVIHEQNAAAGLTNRLLARLADRVLVAFPEAFPGRRDTVLTGNPVRPQIAALEPPEVRFAGRTGPLRLLVLGGSQGARALNEAVPAALQELVQRRARDSAAAPGGDGSECGMESGVEVWHQSGAGQEAVVRAAYEAAGLRARVAAFIEDMPAAYAWADLVVCRAGALTLAELTAGGCAAVLVPYPHAADDHQTRNARSLEAAGAALVLPQHEGPLAPRLARVLAGFLDVSRDVSRDGFRDGFRDGPGGVDRERLLAMARAARAQARPEAAAQVARICLEVAHG